ncbi:MAG: guanylate kinase [Rhodospirillaceae bacterium]|jgi:guanylate kinase|nr:guanylate kinase [Rhodospirillales bacterium]MBT3905183.1 guanylate kinase [Rhodospirillaceae bacterium]MBT4702228.1 guanylate kinase [Rhodospirillaceae bacterium]MBT5035791.1 guanylate kinase [Rhodospirillaceae bacterium]MBT6218794.1 guanylate kinase [Rhodospirillaceae bacterium]
MADKIVRRGLMLVMSSPSGAGKTTISRELMRLDDNLIMSVSATTRAPRSAEVEGKDYFFVDHDGFKNMLEENEFLEHAEVFGNFYGTPRGPVEAALSKGQDVLFDVDWQGTQQLEESAGKDLVSIFILPPSTAELERRLTTRAQDSEDVVRSRMAKAADEMSHFQEYQYVIVNHDVSESVVEVQSILRAERLKRARQIGLHEFVTNLREG